MLPWAATMTVALIKPLFSWHAEPGKFEASRFLWVYALFIFLFFSLSTSKLPPYILPMFFALALLAGEKSVHSSRFSLEGVFAIVLGTALAILGVLMAGFSKSDSEAGLFLMYRPWVFASAFFMLGAGISVILYRNEKWLAPGLFALFSLLALQMLSFGYQSFSTKRSTHYLAQAVAPLSDKGVEIYSIYRYYQSLSYYLGTEVNVVGFTGELEFGIRQRPERWLTGLQFLELWPDKQQAIAVMPHEIFESWKKQEIPMRLIYQDAGHVAVARQ